MASLHLLSFPFWTPWPDGRSGMPFCPGQRNKEVPRETLVRQTQRGSSRECLGWALRIADTHVSVQEVCI